MTWSSPRVAHSRPGVIISSHPCYHEGSDSSAPLLTITTYIVMCFFPGLYNTIVMHYCSNFKFIFVIIVYFVSVPWIIPVKWCVTVTEKHRHQSWRFSQKKTILVSTWHIFLSFIIHQLLAAQWYSNKISQLPSYKNEIKSNKYKIDF